MRIQVREIIETDAAITFDLGVKVREVYGHAWRESPLELDFAGIRSISPSFLSQSVSPIIREFPPEQVADHLKFSNVPPTFDLIWQQVQQAAARIRSS